MRSSIFIVLIIVSSFFYSCSRSSDSVAIIEMKTSLGDIRLKLYNETPLHRDNFIKLVKSGFYENIPFHRVINHFMIQAGDESLKPGLSQAMKDSISRLTVPAEFRPELYHKKGALAAAREGNDVNPLMLSSATQFYIVQGKKFESSQMDSLQQVVNNNIRKAQFIRLLHEITDSSNAGLHLTDAQIQERATLRLYDLIDKTGERILTEEQRKSYSTAGGVPRLDGTYTVFGEVISGFEVIDRIAAVETGPADKPVNDVLILKMKLIRK